MTNNRVIEKFEFDVQLLSASVCHCLIATLHVEFIDKWLDFGQEFGDLLVVFPKK